MRIECEDAFRLYRERLERGVAKELARILLPQNVYTQAYWTVSLQGVIHFLAQRLKHRRAIRDPALRRGRVPAGREPSSSASGITRELLSAGASEGRRAARAAESLPPLPGARGALRPPEVPCAPYRPAAPPRSPRPRAASFAQHAQPVGSGGRSRSSRRFRRGRGRAVRPRPHGRSSTSGRVNTSTSRASASSGATAARRAALLLRGRRAGASPSRRTRSSPRARSCG
jgi:hypothetical protein